MTARRKPPPADAEQAVYLGREMLGSVARKGAGYIAHDADGRRLGLYGNRQIATAAVIDAARRGREIGGAHG
jgi:hypothetical protein